MRWIRLTLAAFIFVAPTSAVGQDRVKRVILAGVPDDFFVGPRSADVLLAQVLLDRARHSPGVIDGATGGNTRRAIRAYQRMRGSRVDGKLNSALLRQLVSEHPGDVYRRYTVTAEDAARPFQEVPAGMEAQAEMEKVAYERPSEALAEKFHMSESFLIALNPGADFGTAGVQINVVAAGGEQLPVKVARIEVDKQASALRAYAADGSIVATYPATIGSGSFPSPSGTMEVRAVAPAPIYYFDPSGREWGPDRSLTIAAGPNNPVGSTWIDLTKDGYGIHGTPEPGLIGKTASHGCVRLTNWDAEELGKAVTTGTIVAFI